MSKIKQRVKIDIEEIEKIRHSHDPKLGVLFFSITDVMALLTESTDARNYWKVLKNRLKTKHNELVMDCNQLKMKAQDGKYYMVDVADADTLVKIIQIIAPYNAPAFRSAFDHIEIKNAKNGHQKNEVGFTQNTKDEKISNGSDLKNSKLSTSVEMPVDIYENKNEIVLIVPLPAYDPEKLFISTNMSTITIKGSRITPKNNSREIPEEDYFIKELKWDAFERIIKLPNFIDIENTSAHSANGMLTITLVKINPEKTRYIKVKN